MLQKLTSQMKVMNSVLNHKRLTLQDTVHKQRTHMMMCLPRIWWTVGLQVTRMKLCSRAAKVTQLQHSVLMGRNLRGPVHQVLTPLRQPVLLHTLPIQNSIPVLVLVPKTQRVPPLMWRCSVLIVQSVKPCPTTLQTRIVMEVFVQSTLPLQRLR